MKRPETPAAQFIAHHAEVGSPRSIRAYNTADDLDYESVNDTSLQMIDPNDSALHMQDEDEGYEGFENVRVCCVCFIRLSNVSLVYTSMGH